MAWAAFFAAMGVLNLYVAYNYSEEAWVNFKLFGGMGLMLGVKMKTDSRAFVTYLRDHGLLTVAAGDNVVRVLPPLIVEEAHISEFIEKLSAAARAYEIPKGA